MIENNSNTDNKYNKVLLLFNMIRMKLEFDKFNSDDILINNYNNNNMIINIIINIINNSMFIILFILNLIIIINIY